MKSTSYLIIGVRYHFSRYHFFGEKPPPTTLQLYL